MSKEWKESEKQDKRMSKRKNIRKKEENNECKKK